MTENEMSEELRKFEILKMWLRSLKVFTLHETGTTQHEIAKTQMIELGPEVELIVHERTPGY